MHITFLATNNKDSSANKLNQDLNRINYWTFQWKMSFNLDSSKEAQKVIFFLDLQKSTHRTLSFINNTITQSVTQKQQAMLLNTKLDFQEHVKSLLKKVNKTIRLLSKLHNTLPRLLFAYCLKVIYKTLTMGTSYSVSFYPKLEPIQYNSALAITGAIREISTQKIYNELGLESF